METGQIQITTFIPLYGKLQNAISLMVYKAKELQKYLRSLLRLRIRNILQMAFLGIIAGIVYGSLNAQPIGSSLLTIIVTGSITGFVMGISLGVVEEFVLQNRYKRRPFYFLIITRTVIYALLSFLSLTLIISLSLAITKNIDFGEAMGMYTAHENFKFDFLFAFFTGFVINFIIQINKFFGPGVFKKILTGRYHTPREEERIFMFVDLRGSTSLAEKLGNRDFSLLLQDFFFDINEAIALTKGEIYQYVGDEVVISWPMNTLHKNNEWIDSYFMMQTLILRKRKKYLDQYGIVPEFKAGMHCGKVIAAWVGEIKKEIVFHGDVLNTTARILAQCNELNENFLISEELCNQIAEDKEIDCVTFPNVALKGKEYPMNLIALHRR